MSKKLQTIVYTALIGAAIGLPGIASADFRLESSEITPGGMLPDNQVYAGFGCTGGNESPQLQWSGEPKETKSFAVTAYDPDAPTGSGWWHWLIYNIPADIHELPHNAGDVSTNIAPKGSTQGKSDFGVPGYGGACPPKGSKPHRYQFRIFALDVPKLALPKGASGALIGYNLNAHALGIAKFEALFQR